MAFVFGVVVLALPSNYLIAAIKAMKRGKTMEGVWSFIWQSKAYDPGHLSFLPYLFLITVLFMPLFLYIVRVHNRAIATRNNNIDKGGDQKEKDDLEVSIAIMDFQEKGGSLRDDEGERQYSRAGGDLAQSFSQLLPTTMAHKLVLCFGIHTLMYAWWALSVSPSMWILAGVTVAMCVWISKCHDEFQEKLRDISDTLLFLTLIVIPLLASHLNSRGDPFFIHPFGLSLFLLTFLIAPLLPTTIEVPIGRVSDGSGFTLNTPLLAIGLVVFSQLFCLTYPERLLTGSSAYVDLNPLSWLLPGHIYVSERTVHSWGFMLIGHSAFFAGT